MGGSKSQRSYLKNIFTDKLSSSNARQDLFLAFGEHTLELLRERAGVQKKWRGFFNPILDNNSS